MQREFLATALCAAALSASAQQPIDRVKITDNELTCRQIHGEIGQMDGIAKSAGESRDASKNVALGADAAAAAAPVAAQAAAASGSIGAAVGLSQLAPLANLFGGLAKTKAADNANQAQEYMRSAQARKEHLTTLFVNKGCKASDLDAAPVAPEKPLVVAAAAPAAALVAPQPVDVAQLAAQPLDAAKSAEVKSTLGGLIGKAPKLAVAGFRVAFVTKRGASAYAGAGVANIGATNRITQSQNKSIEISLQGVDAKLMQAIADRAYADFMARLRATGREVVELDTVRATEAFKSIKPVALEDGKPYAKDEWLVVSPSAFPLWFMHAEPLGGASLDLDNWRAMNRLSVDLNAVVLAPTVGIDFAAVSSSGRSNLGSYAEVGAQAGMAVVGGLTSVLAFHAEKPIAGDIQAAQLRTRIALPGEFGETKEVDSYNDARTVNALTMVTGLQGTQRSSRKLAVLADPARYAARAVTGVLTANQIFVDAIARR